MPLILIALLGIYLVCWQLYKLRGGTTSFGQVALAVGLLGLLGNTGLNRLHAADILTDGRVIPFLRDLCAIVGLLGWWAFRLAIERVPMRNRRFVNAVVLAIVVLAVLAVLTFVLTPPGGSLVLTRRHLHSPVNRAFHIVEAVYLSGMLLSLGRWLYGYARGGEDLHFRLGLRITAVGIYGLAALVAGRTIPVVVVALGGPVWYPPKMTFHIWSSIFSPLLFIGVSYALVMSRLAAMRTWRRQREIYQRIGVVWRDCRSSYPAMVMHPLTTLERLFPGLWRQVLLTRRRNECFDGLTNLLANELPAPTPAGRAAAERLREAVRTHDETHSGSIWAAVSPDDHNEALDHGDATPSDTEPGTAMLLELADILTATRRAQPQESARRW
jgi:hypothetical protein